VGLDKVTPVISALRHAIAVVKRRWSVIGWVTKSILCRAPPCLGRYVKPLVSAAFAVVSTHQPALSPRGGLWLGSFSLCVIHKEGLCPSSGDINRLMMMTQNAHNISFFELVYFFIIVIFLARVVSGTK
jgi:hypothetical protein